MAYKAVVVIVASLFLIQHIQCEETQDPRIQACSQKIWDQVEQLQYGKVPLCFDIDKLKTVTKETKVFEDFNDEIPEKCKKLTTDNVSECFQIVSEMISNKSDDLKTGILNSIKGVIGSFSNCFDVFKNRILNLDKYLANGCED